MFKSAHKTTFMDVLMLLATEGPQQALDIGDRYWPDKAHLGPSRGGPSCTHVAASRMLGRMRAAGLVEQAWHSNSGRRWSITQLGRTKLKEHGETKLKKERKER